MIDMNAQCEKEQDAKIALTPQLNIVPNLTQSASTATTCSCTSLDQPDQKNVLYELRRGLAKKLSRSTYSHDTCSREVSKQGAVQHVDGTRGAEDPALGSENMTEELSFRPFTATWMTFGTLTRLYGRRRKDVKH